MIRPLRALWLRFVWFKRLVYECEQLSDYDIRFRGGIYRIAIYPPTYREKWGYDFFDCTCPFASWVVKDGFNSRVDAMWDAVQAVKDWAATK